MFAVLAFARNEERLSGDPCFRTVTHVQPTTDNLEFLLMTLQVTRDPKSLLAYISIQQDSKGGGGYCGEPAHKGHSNLPTDGSFFSQHPGNHL